MSATPGIVIMGVLCIQVVVCSNQMHGSYQKFIIIASVHDVTALRQDVKELVELVQKLVTEFRAVKLELEASRLDVDSIRAALCEVVGSKQSNCQ